ncbi:HNH endonuclease [Yimella sp. NH-Cas1]|uniref:HNH endonuclease n=1 Tax=Yimella sp. NH-Cas1 TaxID=2917726 RepID=UPI001EFA47C3|nr:HNH endonuclease [Yimella sp. NH-Cas1]
MADEHGYWDWRDMLLLHPEGRATGEPCVKCGEPVPSNAHWTHRDRHVCSARCNGNLSRQFNRRMRAGVLTDLHGRAAGSPQRLPNPRTTGPRPFVTNEGSVPPFEWEGFGVVPGDVVERYGIVVEYALLHRDQEPTWPNWWPEHVMVAIERESGQQALWGADSDGNLTAVSLLYCSPDGGLTYDDTFLAGGVRCRWHCEIVSACTDNGREYTWEAIVAAPTDSPYKPVWWTPERTALSERRKRESSSTARHLRRMRELAATAERFDPREVYERDGWVCGLCGEAVDRSLRWPDLMSPSLDHVTPLIANGEHSRANTQLAHWICNVRKGAKVAAELAKADSATK